MNKKLIAKISDNQRILRVLESKGFTPKYVPCSGVDNKGYSYDAYSLVGYCRKESSKIYSEDQALQYK